MQNLSISNQAGVTRHKKSNAEVISSPYAASVTVAEIGALQIKIAEIEAARDASLKEIIEAAEKKVENLLGKKRNQIEMLHTYAAANRDEITQEGKTIECKDGEYGWRLTNPKVVIDDDVDMEKLIARAEKAKSGDYVRIKKSLDKRELLANRPRLKGVAYDQNEEFFVSPRKVAVIPSTQATVVDAVE